MKVIATSLVRVRAKVELGRMPLMRFLIVRVKASNSFRILQASLLLMIY